MKSLIIVESPAKVKTIRKFLGNQYAVQASVGHVRDLPPSELGVDEGNDFAPKYEVIDGKEKVVKALRDAAAKADIVYLAPDPDREGEAIAWHVAELIKEENKNVQRIQFNEITSKAVHEALEHPRPLNVDLFDAQQARRVLDRLVGYKISPLLWKNIKRGISAGRVQSVALRLVVDREEERRAFVPEEFWPFKVSVQGSVPPPFRADLHKIGKKKALITNGDDAQALEDTLRGQPFTIAAIEEKERERKPQPPFITSSLQQAANQRLSFSAKRTMNIAQRLYEGVELGEQGTVALITYMRTDSVRIADEAKKAAAEYIEEHFGKDYLPKGARTYRTKSGAQDAHEAIRPIDVTLSPEAVKPFLAPEQFRLYQLIWSRFVASQMAGARFHDTTVSLACVDTEWRAKGERLLFNGFLAVMPRTDDEGELPPLTVGEELTLISLEKEQRFTQPPARYSEASLVRELEEQGIGRPSTYAAIISTLQDRDYVRLEEKHFIPTDLGETVCEKLKAHFATLMDVHFTAEMESRLDKVAEGALNWVDLLRTFADDFNPTLEAAGKAMSMVKTGIPSGLACPECGKDLLVKFGKAGPFLACAGYPACKHTCNFSRDEKGIIQVAEKMQEAREVVGVCPKCGKDLVIKQARTGSKFIACTGYPQCTHAAALSTGVPCPKEGCTGELVEKSTKKGKLFYSCNRYPQCDYALWDRPIAEECPECHSPLLVEKNSRSGKQIKCPNAKCSYVKPEEDA